MSRMIAAVSWVALAGLAAVAGCGGSAETVKAPPTVVVKGTVLDKAGKPFPGGSIEFRLVTNSQFNSIGMIRDDGTFSLKTIAGNNPVEGVQEGEHNVTIMPKIGAKQDVRPITLKKPVTVKAGDNDLTIKLEQ